MTSATLGTAAVRSALIDGREIVLLDVREEGPYSRAHPLFAVSVPLSRIELIVLDLVPRFAAPVVVYDDGEGLAEPAAVRLRTLGYTDVSVLDGGLSGWIAAGGEVYRDVGVPSKAFGEWVEHHRHTPSMPAAEVKALIDAGADHVILDARRFEEYRTMSIPGGISVPGGGVGAPRLRHRTVAGHAGHRQLRRADPLHHRDAVAGQRRHPEPGRRAAQRHHRLPLATDLTRLPDEPNDVYKRPYEGMERDGTHRFRVT